MPRTRGGYRTQVFKRYHRRQQELDTMIADMFISGVSQTRVGEVVETLTGSKPSASTVSRVFQSLESEYEQWTTRTLAAGYVYAFADGTYFTVIYNGEGCKMPILAVVGIAENGEREVLAFRVGDLDKDQPLYALQDPHMHEEDYPTLPVEQMAAEYVEAITRIQPEGPYHLCGYSFGGVIAFEMAQQLKRRGQQIGLLVNFDGGAPAHSRQHSLQDEARFLAIITLEMTRHSLNKAYEEVYHDLDARTLPEKLLYVQNHLRLAGVEIPGEEKRWITQQMRIFQSRTRALQQYHPQLYHGEITLLKSTDQDAEASEDRGWGQLTSLPLQIEVVAGHHETLFLEPIVQQIAEKLNLLLNRHNQRIVVSVQ